MADEVEIGDLRDITAELAQSARELSDAARSIAEATRVNGSSSIVIDAGGIPAGIAVGIGVVAMATVLMLGFWLMLQLSRVQSEVASSRQDLQDQMTAWVTVMQREAAKKESDK